MLQQISNTQLSKFEGSVTTLTHMVEVAQGLRGEKSPMVRKFAEHVIGQITPKDYLSEILAVNNWVTKKVFYVNDPLHVEYLKDPQRLLEEIQIKSYTRGDCDDIACLIATMCLTIGRKADFVVVGFSPDTFSHVFCRVWEPKSGKPIVCDPVAGDQIGKMLRRVKNYQIWSCDESPKHGPIARG